MNSDVPMSSVAQYMSWTQTSRTVTRSRSGLLEHGLGCFLVSRLTTHRWFHSSSTLPQDESLRNTMLSLMTNLRQSHPYPNFEQQMRHGDIFSSFSSAIAIWILTSMQTEFGARFHSSLIGTCHHHHLMRSIVQLAIPDPFQPRHR